MKKYFVLLFVLCFNLFSYDYLIYDNSSIEGPATSIKQYFFRDPVGVLRIVGIRFDDREDYYSTFYTQLSRIKYQNFNNYISDADFQNIYKEDLQFLNDFYTQQTNSFLNYLYNDEVFDNNSFINYENYQLLYNSEGLAVESIVNSVWAGLYSDSEKGVSGRMYNDSGTLVYYNGEAVSWIGSSLDRIFGSIGDYMYQAFQILASPIGVIVSVVFVMSILYFVVRIGRNAIMPFTGKVRKRFLQDH